MRTNLKTFEFSTILVVAALLVFSSCNTNKYLVGDQKYVAPSKYSIKADKRIKNKSDIQFELSNLEKQKPNAKLLGIARARLWYHYRIQAKQDSSKFDKWIARVIAEEPSILDSVQTDVSAKNMVTYLKRKGYFDATVNWSLKIKKHTAASVYDIDLASVYTIDTAMLNSRDTALLEIINRFSEETFLKTGEPLSFENYQLERNRIRAILRNHGYAQFQNNFFTRLRGDSTIQDDRHMVRIEYDIITPTDSTYHRKFRIGEITVLPSYTPETSLLLTHDSIINDIRFRTQDGTFEVKPKTILENIFLNKGEQYRQVDQDKTSIQLSNLGIFRFVSIKPIFPPDDSGVIDFEIYLTTNKKLALGINAEINNTNRTSTSTSLVGTALSINWRNRNLFKGAELLLLNVEGGLEIDPSSSNRLISNVNFSPEISVFIPRFIDYIGIWKRIGKKNPNDTQPGFYKQLLDNASSRLSLRYSYVSLDNFYTFNSFESSFGYNADNIRGKSYSIDHIGIDYLTPTIDSTFASTAPVLLQRSLTRQLITGLFFKELDRKSVRRIDRKNSTQTTLLHVEQSGMEAFAIDQIFNRNDTLRVGNSELSKFFALSYDWSRVRRFNLNNALAIRLFGGIVTPFGDSEVVPFVKQYNAGGPNSVRAWRLYELGPGSFRDPRLDEPGNTQNVIQSGEVKLEANLEYRFDLFWRLKSALFIDAGNIWTLDDDADRPGSTISSDWYKQLAIGTGVGFRFDFTYFIFRVDVGWKARTPYENDNGKHWNLNSLSDFSKRSNRYTSIALGYPF